LDKAMDDALMEAVGIAKAYGDLWRGEMDKAKIAKQPRDRRDWESMMIASTHISCDILALRTQAPEQAQVTVQEAAKVLLGTMTNNRHAFDQMVEAAEDAHSAGASFNKVIGNAIRAIAGAEAGGVY
jgi:hypothetical protein